MRSIQHKVFISSLQLYDGSTLNSATPGTAASAAVTALAGEGQPPPQPPPQVAILCKRGQEGVSIQSLAGVPLEFVQDPSSPPRAATAPPTSSSSSSSTTTTTATSPLGDSLFPRLLLKANARNELRLTFQLEGSMVALAAGAATAAGAGAAVVASEATGTIALSNGSSSSRPNSVCDSSMSATSTAPPPQQQQQQQLLQLKNQEPSPPSDNVHDAPADSHPLNPASPTATATAEAEAASTITTVEAATTAQATINGQKDDGSSNSGNKDLEGKQVDNSNGRTNDSSPQPPSQELVVVVTNGERREPEPKLQEHYENLGASTMTATPTQQQQQQQSQKTPHPGKHVSPPPTLPPRLYFVEAMSEADLLELCDDMEFQRQAKLNPDMVTVVQPTFDNSSPSSFYWEWRSPSQDRMEGDFAGHKTVFAFMARNPHTGQLEILTQIGIWVTTFTQLEQPSSARFVPTTSYNNSASRHWRRASTPERTSMSTGHIPSLLNRTSASPSNHMSLPGLPEAAAEHTQVDAQLTNTAPSSLTGTANATPMGFDTEDGPLFRATVHECENHIKDMKNATKRILKAAQTVMEARKAWANAEEAFAREMESFRPAEPLVARYSRPMAQSLSERTEVLSQQMRNLLIEPLTRFYSSDIKAAETHRKTFEDESRDYYTYLSKYMAMKQDNGRKKAEAEAKYDKKRRQFELKRHEYWGFLLDMRVGGSKSDEILHHLTNYSEKHCRHVMDLGLLAEDLRAGLDRMNEQLLESHRKSTALRKEWQEKRRELLDTSDDSLVGGFRSPLSRSGSNNDLLQLGAPPSLSSQSSAEGGSGSSGTPRRKGSLPGPYLLDSAGMQDNVSVSTTISSPPMSHSTQTAQTNHSQPRKFAGIRDLEQQDVDASQALGRRKEGFLFATSRPSMHSNSTVLEKPSINWHKYWCVLSEGHLHEYSHWKKGVTTLHNEPIHLKTATVRASRNQDRRFCFEVITPKFRRVYQAMSAEDMQSWITVISNAIQSLLNGTSSYRNLNISTVSPDYQRLLTGNGGDYVGRPSMEQALMATSLPDSMQERMLQPGQAIGKKRGASAAHGLNELVGQMMTMPTTTAATNMAINAADANSTVDQDQLGIRLLDTMRAIHPANNFCAECGAKNPDWCAINLGILICIECSGIHRSLGTHISKVRSFTLDTTSYTRDLFDFIRAVGNECSNRVWEALLHKEVGDDASSSTTAMRKPVYNDSRDYKVEFIQKKYVDRLFVDRLQFVPEAEQRSDKKSWTNDELATFATKALFQASMENNIPAVLAAYAAGADLNAIQEVEVEQETAGSCMSDISDQPSQSESVEAPSPKQSPPPPLSSSTLQSSKDDTASTTQEETPPRAACSSPPPPTIMTTSPDLRSRSWTGYSNASFCLMQTSPLLLALRHGTPFTLDSQYEVYPLAEFMLQNGAASNLSVEVRLLDDSPLEDSVATTESSATSAAITPAPVPTATTIATTTTTTVSVASEEDDARLAVGDTSIDQLSRRPATPLSIVSVASEPTSSLSAVATSTTPASSTVAASAGGLTTSVTQSTAITVAPRNGWDSLDVDPEQVRQLHMRTNRRSLGEVVHMRGEEGATAMEYLRSKSAARGEPLAATGVDSMSSPATTSMQPRPSMHLHSTGISSASLNSDAVSSSTVNTSTAVSSVSLAALITPASTPAIAATGSPSNKRASEGGRGLAPMLSAIKQNLISHDEKTKDHDGIANGAETSSLHDQPSSAAVSTAAALHHMSTNSAAASTTSLASTAIGGNVHGHHERHSSRAGKMKATLTKSLRMSAAYLKHSIGKDDKDHHSHPTPVAALLSPSSSSTSSNTSSILSGSLFSPPPTHAGGARDIVAASSSTSVHGAPSTATPGTPVATATATMATTSSPTRSPSMTGIGRGKDRTRTTSGNTVLSALSGKSIKPSTNATTAGAEATTAVESTPLSGQYVILHKKGGNTPPTNSSATFASGSSAAAAAAEEEAPAPASTDMTQPLTTQ
ncbi:hypothetical protein BGW41_001819 [Actinomortierella wolfii]|nr:hypothetical protein BGW41_001819 [Actinomortierella wolfii]